MGQYYTIFWLLQFSNIATFASICVCESNSSQLAMDNLKKAITDTPVLLALLSSFTMIRFARSATAFCCSYTEVCAECGSELYIDWGGYRALYTWGITPIEVARIFQHILVRWVGCRILMNNAAPLEMVPWPWQIHCRHLFLVAWSCFRVDFQVFCELF